MTLSLAQVVTKAKDLRRYEKVDQLVKYNDTREYLHYIYL